MSVSARLVQVARKVTREFGRGGGRVVGEFEADMIWRMGCMLGFDDRAIAAVRAESGQGNGFQPGREV